MSIATAECAPQPTNFTHCKDCTTHQVCTYIGSCKKTWRIGDTIEAEANMEAITAPIEVADDLLAATGIACVAINERDMVSTGEIVDPLGVTCYNVNGCKNIAVCAQKEKCYWPWDS